VIWYGMDAHFDRNGGASDRFHGSFTGFAADIGSHRSTPPSPLTAGGDINLLDIRVFHGLLLL